MKFEHINCNICNSGEVKILGKRYAPDYNKAFTTQIVQCLDCGLIYPKPMPRFDTEERQNNFEDINSYFSGPVDSNRIKKSEKIIKFIEKIKPGKGNFLDIGCGRGELAFAAKRAGFKVTATEISPSFAEYAKKKFSINAELGDISKLDLSEGNFDVVCLNSVIQYVENPLDTFKKISFLLKKDGLLYMEATNEDALVFKAADFLQSLKRGEKITTHLSPLFPSFQIYGFNRKALSKALRLSGLEPVYFRVKGIFGGGKIKGKGLGNAAVNILRKIIIFSGGITGRGHLIYCLAKKRG